MTIVVIDYKDGHNYLFHIANILSLNMKIRKFYNKIIGVRLKIIMFKIKTYLGLGLGNHNTKGKFLYK